jgi:Domain of unknown function (DUF5348)
MTEGLLTASSIKGRYAIGSPDGPDLTSGQPCEIWLGGQWVSGRIEHSGGLYADPDTYRAVRGYCFVSSDGGMCGLCYGLHIRIP